MPEVENVDNTESQESTIDNLDDALKVIKDLRKENAAKRTKAREQEEKAAKWEEHLTSQKTELEKLTESNANLTLENGKLKREGLVAKIVREEGIDPEYVDLLDGNSEDELRAKAKKLAALFKKSPGQQPDFFAGQRGQTVAPKAETLNDWFANLWRETGNKL